MILVTVGTESFPFNRLMNWMGVLIQHGFVASEDVVVQYGSCTELPPGSRVYRYVKEHQFHELIRQADVVIAHCGEGTVLQLDALNKSYILVPRSQQFREHVDDHQMELARGLSLNGVPVAWAPGDLIRFLADPQPVSLSTLSKEAASDLCERLERRFGGKISP